MTYIIQKIEDFSTLASNYYATISVCVAVLSVLICFYSHRVREAMSYVVGVLCGSMIGLVTASVILVNSTSVILRGIITLAVALLILYALTKVAFIASAVMIFTPVALAVGFAFTRLTGSTGVGVFVGLVFGALLTVIGVRVGRYFVICVNALAGAFVAVLAVLSCIGVLSKVYEADTMYFYVPILILAVLGSAYQISVNPERLEEKAAKIAAEEERKRFESSGLTWACSHCYATNKKELLYCRECGKTEKEPSKPEYVTLSETANPGWRCSCGHINNLSRHRCECGAGLGKAMEWVCSCGVRNGSTTDLCTGCGQLRYQPYAKGYKAAEVPKVGHAVKAN